MLTPKIPTEKKEVVAEPKALQVIAIEEGEKPLSFVIPPYADLAEIEDISAQQFSIFELVDEMQRQDISLLEEMERLQQKADRFGNSAKFQHRLALLAKFTLNAVDEEGFTRAAASLDKSSFFQHRLGDFLIRHQSEAAAASFFKELNLEDDVVANLRLAALSARAQDWRRAEEFIAQAVRIDGLDFSVRLFEGALHIVGNRFENAVQSLRIALQERPGSASAYCNMAIAYLGMKRREKALAALKKATALDPISANAIALLADVAFSLKRAEEALPALRYFVSLDQTNPAMWSRLARGAFELGKFDETNFALQQQAAIQDSAGVWNNLGVTYLALGNRSRAWTCFHHALRMDEPEPGKVYFLAAKNAAQMLADSSRFDELTKFVSKVIARDEEGLIARDPHLSNLVTLLAFGLVKSKRQDEAESILFSYLESQDLSDSLAVWIVSTLAGLHGLNHQPIDFEKLSAVYDAKADAQGLTNPTDRIKYYNNISFALAEMGRIEEAEKAFEKIVNCVHRSAYPTATFGLIQLRKGRVDRASQLYEKAITLASGKEDKTRIRQKFNLELGKFWLQSDRAKARRFLSKATDQKLGEPLLSGEASRLLKLLGR